MTHRQVRQVSRQGRADLRPKSTSATGKKVCKECGAEIPRGTSFEDFCCRGLGLCLYCYEAEFPEREMAESAPLTHGNEPLLSYGERREMEKKQFEGQEHELWDKDFLEEWLDYLEDRGCLGCED